MNCCNCNKEIPDGSEFCNFCGSKQEKKLFCPNCGRELPTDSEFCQYCRTAVKQPERIQVTSNESPIILEKKSNNKLILVLIISVAVVVLAAVAVILFTGSTNKRNETSEEMTTKAAEKETKTKSFEDMTIEEKMAASQYISLSDFKGNENYISLVGQNLHFSGYVVEDEWDQPTGITIAESQEWPYDFTTEIEYADIKGGGPLSSLTEYAMWTDEFNSIEKTTTVYVALDKGGQAVKRPLKGDFVDVFFVGDGRIRALAYCIVVR